MTEGPLFDYPARDESCLLRAKSKGANSVAERPNHSEARGVTVNLSLLSTLRTLITLLHVSPSQPVQNQWFAHSCKRDRGGTPRAPIGLSAAWSCLSRGVGPR